MKVKIHLDAVRKIIREELELASLAETASGKGVMQGIGTTSNPGWRRAQGPSAMRAFGKGKKEKCEISEKSSEAIALDPSLRAAFNTLQSTISGHENVKTTGSQPAKVTVKWTTFEPYEEGDAFRHINIVSKSKCSASHSFKLEVTPVRAAEHAHAVYFALHEAVALVPELRMLLPIDATSAAAVGTIDEDNKYVISAAVDEVALEDYKATWEAAISQAEPESTTTTPGTAGEEAPGASEEEEAASVVG